MLNAKRLALHSQAGIQSNLNASTGRSDEKPHEKVGQYSTGVRRRDAYIRKLRAPFSSVAASHAATLPLPEMVHSAR